MCPAIHACMHSFIHSTDIYLSTYYLPGTVLGTEEPAENTENKISAIRAGKWEEQARVNKHI